MIYYNHIVYLKEFIMIHLLLPIAVGVLVSLAVFLFFESRAIAAKRANEKLSPETREISLPENLKRYDTDRNVLFYTLTMFVFTLFFSYIMFFSKGLTLVDVFLYTFLTTFVGSVIILTLKLKRSILVKVFAAFLYGAPLIGASIFGFLFSYLVFINM